MTAHLVQNFLYASPASVGRGVYRAMLSSSRVVYLPFWAMLVVRAMPETLLARLDL